MTIQRHRTCFLVKYFEISLTPTRVFVRVKSESYKIMGHLCAVLSSTECCVYPCRHPSSLFTVFAEDKKNYTGPGITFRFSCSVQRLVTWNMAFWTHQRQRDKAKCKDKIVCRRLSGKSTQIKVFNFLSSIRLVRTLHRSFDVNMIQTTKCSQEDKVWLIVIVF